MTEDYDDDVYWNYIRWIKPFETYEDWLPEKPPLWFWEV